MARMSETLRTLFSGDGSFSDRLIDMIDELVDPANRTKHPFKRSFIFEPLEERVVLNAAPTFVDLPDEITVIAGDSFHLALNGHDDDGDALTFGTSSSLASVLSGNSSIRMKIVQKDADGKVIKDFGYITIELFENDAPLTTARIKQIVESGFYQDKLFHRIIDGFMIQGGSKSGTGTDGTGTQFNDEFSTLLRHNGKGIVSMANSGFQKDADGEYILDANGNRKGTNDSQFFITDAATTWLDDLHSIFGFLTSGYDVLDEVSAVPTKGGEGSDKDRPTFDIVMEDVQLIDNDTENGVLRIKADKSMANTTQEITVFVDDGNGNKVEKKIKVNVAPAAADLKFDEPVVAEVDAGKSVIVDLPGLANIPKDQIKYYLEAYEGSHPGMTYKVTADNKLEITAAAGVSGPQYVWIAGQEVLDGWVRGVEGRYMMVVVTPAAPTVTWTGGDNGTEGDGITSNNNKDESTALQFTVDNVVPGASIKLYANGVEVPFKTVSDTYYDDAGNVVTSTSTNVARRKLVVETVGSGENKLNDGTYNFTVIQSHTPTGFKEALVSDASAAIKVIVATVAPNFVSPLDGFVYDISPGETLTIPVKTNKPDATDIVIAFDGTVPSGMTLSEDGKSVTWTPAADIEPGDYTFTLKLTDGAGNSRTTTCTVSVQKGLKFDVEGDTDVDEGETIMLDLKPSEPGEGEEPYDGPLTFEIESSTLPEGAEMSITQSEDGRSALFMWTTTEADGPGVYTITFKVTDENGNTRKKMIQLTVDEVNSDPYFKPEDFEETYHVKEHEELVIDVKAHDDDIPKNALSYSLVGDNIPEGMTINETTGKLTWTPGEQYGGQMYKITIEVTDEHGATARHTITIDIEETDDPPVFTPVDPISVYDDFGNLKWDMHAVDPDIPTNEVRYSLAGDNIPEGMTINPTTGEIIWNIPAGYAGSDVPFLKLGIEVKATEVIRTQTENDLGEIDIVETDGLATSYTVTLTIFSRGYEARMEAERQEQAAAWTQLQSQFQSTIDIPGLPGAGFDPLAMRDVPGGSAYYNAQRANGRIESPMLDPHHDTRFRDRFDTISFGVDNLGSGEVTDPEQQQQPTQRENERSQQPASTAPATEQGGYRSNRPISPGAFLRSVESGFSRMSTPLLDALDNVDVGRAVADAQDAGQTISTYYNNAAQSTTRSGASSHDAAMRDWDNASARDDGAREQFRSLRLK